MEDSCAKFCLASSIRKTLFLLLTIRNSKVFWITKSLASKMRKLFQNWLWCLRPNWTGGWKLALALGPVTSGNQRWRSDSPLITGGSTASRGNLSKHLIFLTGKSETLNFFFFLMQFKACISSPAHHGHGNRPYDFPWYVLLLCPIFLFPFCHVFSSADWPTQIL